MFCKMNKRIKIGLSVVGAGSLIGGAFYISQFNTSEDVKSQIKPVEDPRQYFSIDINPYYRKAIEKSSILIKGLMTEIGCPGLVVGVSVDGQILWKEGFGMANLETQTPCLPDTKMRIASISKPITTLIMAKLYEKKLLDFDQPIQSYVDYFPEKTFNNNPAEITARLLACHKAGIRHYKESKEGEGDGGPEFYIKDRYDSIEAAVGIFKDDDLLFAPGDSFKYTTFGYTLLSAVLEGASHEKFPSLLKVHLNELGMKETFLDEVNTIIYNRASYYTKNKKGRIINAHLTDNSYKWAGGGLVSTVGDLLKFGNAMLYSYQQTSADKPGILKKETVRRMWTSVEGTKMSWGFNAGYGLGWTVVPSKSDVGGVQEQKFYVGHGGGAVGASSVILIFPNDDMKKGTAIPKGLVIAILVNLQDVSVHNLAKQIYEIFHNVSQLH